MMMMMMMMMITHLTVGLGLPSTLHSRLMLMPGLTLSTGWLT